MGPGANKIGDSGALAMCGGRRAGNALRSSGLMDTLSALSPRAASVLEYLGHTMGLGGDTADSVGAHSQGSSGADKRRTLRVALSMHDPTLCDALVRAHQMFVSGESLKALRAAGINMGHLIRIGVTFEEWIRCGYSARDVGFMEGQWHSLAQMGFTPKHMVGKRENSGPAVICAHPFNATFNDLERDLGLTIDESVFECGLSTADFSILGETIGTMRRRGFHATLAQHMKEPPYNYNMSLDANEHDILFLFPNPQTQQSPETETRPLGQVRKTEAWRSYRNQSEPATNSGSATQTVQFGWRLSNNFICHASYLKRLHGLGNLKLRHTERRRNKFVSLRTLLGLAGRIYVVTRGSGPLFLPLTFSKTVILLCIQFWRCYLWCPTFVSHMPLCRQGCFRVPGRGLTDYVQRAYGPAPNYRYL